MAQLLVEVQKKPGVDYHIAGYIDQTQQQLRDQSRCQNLEEEESFRDEQSAQVRRGLQDCRPSVRTVQLVGLTMGQEQLVGQETTVRY